MLDPADYLHKYHEDFLHRLYSFMDKFSNLTVNVLQFSLKIFLSELFLFRTRNDFCAMTERSFMRVAEAEAALIRNCEKCEKYVMMMADNQ